MLAIIIHFNYTLIITVTDYSKNTIFFTCEDIILQYIGLPLSTLFAVKI